MARDYPRAISVGLAFNTAFETYDEGLFHEVIYNTRKILDWKLEELRLFLIREAIRHQFIPHGRQDPATLLALFPHKLAATRAGLGWIGKNSLLITEEFGPRIHLSTVLLDIEAEYGRPVTAPDCGDCRSCVDACPYGCLHDTIWYPGIDRADLFDAFTCSLKREGFIPSLGRKHECGLCLFACPQSGDTAD